MYLEFSTPYITTYLETISVLYLGILLIFSQKCHHLPFELCVHIYYESSTHFCKEYFSYNFVKKGHNSKVGF